MHKSILYIFFFILSFLVSCAATPENNSGNTEYNFGKPDLTLNLPDTLREISGLTILDSQTFACVQDENGILFIYDILRNEIKKQYSFHIDGDYEGITRAGNSIYILRSDGRLFEIINFQSSDFSLKSYITGVPANNNEGLCYDEKNKRLLIACKGKIGKGREFRDRRVIYGFDLQKKELSKEPVFDFDLQTIKDFAIKKNINLPVKSRKKKGVPVKEPFIKFRTSAIDIHPFTNYLYLLSAADYMIFIFDSAGNVKHMEKLDSEIFNKAEGISFFRNGDLLITNEAQDKKATVLKFHYINP